MRTESSGDSLESIFKILLRESLLHQPITLSKPTDVVFGEAWLVRKRGRFHQIRDGGGWGESIRSGVGGWGGVEINCGRMAKMSSIVMIPRFQTAALHDPDTALSVCPIFLLVARAVIATPFLFYLSDCLHRHCDPNSLLSIFSEVQVRDDHLTRHDWFVFPRSLLMSF